MDKAVTLHDVSSYLYINLKVNSKQTGVLTVKREHKFTLSHVLQAGTISIKAEGLHFGAGPYWLCISGYTARESWPASQQVCPGRQNVSTANLSPHRNSLVREGLMLLPGVQEAHSEQQRGADNSPQACRKSARGQATDPNVGWDPRDGYSWKSGHKAS